MSLLPETPLLYSDEQLAQLLLEAQHHERLRLLGLFSLRLKALASQISLCQYNSREATELLQGEAETLSHSMAEEAH